MSNLLGEAPEDTHVPSSSPWFESDLPVTGSLDQLGTGHSSLALTVTLSFGPVSVFTYVLFGF